jgi:hypothetical protein
MLTFEIPPESITPTAPADTQTPMPSLTPTLTPTDTPTSTAEATVIPVTPPQQGNIQFGDWLVALVLALTIGGTNYWVIYQRSGLRWGVRAALLPLIGGMFMYFYLAINMPGSETMLQQLGTWGVVLFVLIGAVLGVAGSWLWQMMELRKIKPPKLSEPG